MSMELQDDPFFELRLYQVEPGRSRDMERRMQDDLGTLFPRNGIRPVGTWTVVAGAAAPLFVYLMPWRQMIQRTRAFAGFVADPGWAEARDRTNAGSELVQRYEILFLRAIRDWQPVTRPADGAIFELILQETAQGRGADVRRAINEVAIPAWTEAGASVCGAFDVMSGYSLPGSAFLLAWPDLATRMKASPPLQARLGGLRAADGRTSLLQRADQYLMQPVPVDWK